MYCICAKEFWRNETMKTSHIKKKTSTKGGTSPSRIFEKNIPGWLMILPTLMLFALIIWRPICIGIGYSFFDLKGFTLNGFVGLDNYKDVLTDTNFIVTLKNTVMYVFWSLIIGFPLPFICAIMMNELRHMKGFFKVTTYLPVVIPSIATAMIWKMIYMGGEGGLLNMILYFFGMAPVDWLGNKSLTIPLIIVAMSWNGFGSTLIVYLASLQSINKDLYEAASLDGCGIFKKIKYILFPHMRGILLLNFVRQIIGVFNITEQPLAMTGGGPNGASMSLGLTNYFYAFKYGQYDRALAVGVITFLLLLIWTLVYFVLDKKINE